MLFPASEFTEDGELKSLLAKDGIDVTVQGVVDVVFETEDGELILADYKTDRLSSFELSHPEAAKKTLRERHSRQLLYYKAACEKIFERRIDRVQIFSLALGDTVDVIGR